jgi:hypothetical protein
VLLGPAVHLLATFLVDKGYGDICSQTSEAGVVLLDNRFGSVSEKDPDQVDNFRFAGLLCLLGVLAGPSSKDKTRDGKVAMVAGPCQSGERRELLPLLQQTSITGTLECGKLLLGGRVGVLKGAEQSLQCGAQVGAVLLVKGTLFVMVPHPCNQTACSTTLSA